MSKSVEKRVEVQTSGKSTKEKLFVIRPVRGISDEYREAVAEYGIIVLDEKR